MGWKDLVFKAPKPEVKDETKYVQLLHTEQLGASGTLIQGGIFDEEYLRELTGTRGMEVYDKMRRNDGQIAMVLKSVMNPIRSAQWEVEAGGEKTEQDEKIAELVEHILFCGLDKPWTKKLSEILTLIPFGYSIFEMVDGVVLDDPKHGSYNTIKKFQWLSQKTIERWHVRNEDGSIESVEQIVNGDINRCVKIPGEWLTVFNIDSEGDNYEGTSMLRTCYGNWFRKQLVLKLGIIGIERYAVPTPIAKIPPGKENSAQKDAMINLLKNLASHQQNYAVMPSGWELDSIKNDFHPDKVLPWLEYEDRQMTIAFLANFLLLGMGKSGGAFALGKDLSDFFLSALDYVAQEICQTLNKSLVKRIVDLNFGPQESYPELKVSGINDKAGQEFASILSTLTGKVIHTDDDLEDHTRERFNLPEANKEERAKRKEAAQKIADAQAGEPLEPGEPQQNPDDETKE